MVKKRLIGGVLAVLLSVGTLTGCSDVTRSVTENDEVDVNVKAKDVVKTDALSLADIASSYSDADKESMVYRYVANSVRIDEDSLISLDSSTQSKETEAIDGVMTAINNALITGESTPVIGDDLLNYMLLKFANTPYAWEQEEVKVLGMDAQTRLYFVDVTYKTVMEEEKGLLPDSVIVHGSNNETERLKKRYTDYITWITDRNKWEELVLGELRAADAASVLLNGQTTSNDVVMDGYEEDQKQEEIDERLAQEEALIREYVSYGVDPETGVETRNFNYTFEDRWGSIDEIMRTQDGITLLERVKMRSQEEAQQEPEVQEPLDPDDPFAAFADFTYPETTQKNTIGVYTYSGLTQVAAKHGATMTFRFILREAYDVGLNDHMSVRAMYLKDYELDDSDSLIADYTTETITNGEVLKPYIERLIKAYRKAIDDTNHVGLYNLFAAYEKYDTYFSDMHNYSYVTSGGFHVELLGRKGNELAVKVIQNTKDRAKGTKMTMTTYNEEVLLKVKLCEDDVLRVVSMTLLKSHVTGEPLSIVRDVKGISDQISYNEGDFTANNQAAVEKVIQEFSKIQMNWTGDFQADAWDTLDSSVSSSVKAGFKDSFNSVAELNPSKSAVWLVGYSTKSNLYVNCKLREVYVGDSTNYTIESELGIIYRNSTWKVVNYQRTLAVKSGHNPNFSTTECLVLNDKNSDEQSILFSWVPDVSSNNDLGGVETDLSNNGDGFEDDSYTVTQATEATEAGDDMGAEGAETQASEETQSDEGNVLDMD